MTDLVPQASYLQHPDEPDAEYAWFTMYLKLAASERSPSKAAARCGIVKRLARDAAVKFDWKARAADYDHDAAKFAREVIPDYDEAMKRSALIGETMLNMGIVSMMDKNPSLISMKDGIKLIELGRDLVAKGSGRDELQVDEMTMDRVDGLLNKLLGGGSGDTHDQ